MAESCVVKVLDEHKVSPPPGSVPTTSLRLTFLDLPWIPCPLVKRLYFYEFPHPTSHFTQTIFPTLKRSLSLTLQHFFPLAGNLRCPPPPTKPYIFYTNGDSVLLTIAESSGNFNHLIGNHPRLVKEFHHLASQLPPTLVSEEDTYILPLLALQITIFPNSGICVGITYRHTVDGSSSSRFMKSWASIYKSGGDVSCLHNSSLPLCDRALIKDPNGIEDIFLKEYFNLRSFLKDNTSDPNAALMDNVRATFVIGRADVERLKQWMSNMWKNNNESQPQYLSRFVVTCAFIWVCLVKAQNKAGTSSLNNGKLRVLALLGDCRNRLEFPVPATYFGNCLAFAWAFMTESELMGETGVAVAAKAIGSEVSRVKNEPLKGAEKWMSIWEEWSKSKSTRILTVSGSPNMGVYETDFGLGRSKKVELAHILDSGSISVAESRDESGGIEVGVVLSRVEMDAFTYLFEQGLKF